MRIKQRNIKKLFLLRLPLIDRYIITEIITFFLFSVGLMSAVGVAIGTVSDLAYKTTEYNLPLVIAVLVFFYKIPEYIAYALPISILLTTLVVYGRLSRDRELIVMRSVGINLYRIVTPALVFSLLVTVITFSLNELVVPASNYQANLLQNPFIPETELNLQRRDIFYPDYEKNISDENNHLGKLKNIYYAEQFDGKKLRGITIIGWQKGRLAQIITARSGQWNEKQQVWDLFEGKIDNLVNNTMTLPTEKFNHKQLPLSPTIFKIIDRERSPEDMNIRQAQEYIDIIKDSGRDQEIALFTVRVQQKAAFPFICLVFALIGSSLGINSNSINRSKGFGLCVAIVFIYYLLGFAIGSLGIVGVLSPFMAAWVPNFFCLSIGIWLLWSANL